MEIFGETSDYTLPFTNFIMNPFEITNDTSFCKDEISENVNNVYFINKPIIEIPEKRKKESCGKKREKKDKEVKNKHDKTTWDNILRKVQVHSLNCLRNLINQVLKLEGYDQQFKDIDYLLKKNITKKYFNELKQQKIGEIFCQQLSGKFKNCDKITNINIYQEVCKNFSIKSILSETYIKYMREIYLKDNNIINYNGFIITIENFKDLLKKMLDCKINGDINKYKDKIFRVINKFYMPQKIFKQEK